MGYCISAQKWEPVPHCDRPRLATLCLKAKYISLLSLKVDVIFYNQENNCAMQRRGNRLKFFLAIISFTDRSVHQIILL